MSYTNQDNPYASSHYGSVFAADAVAEERATFIRKTYLHLAAAIGAFVLIEATIFSLTPPDVMNNTVAWMFSGWNWLIVLGAFMVVGFIADRWANASTSLPMQYAGLVLYVLAEAVIFLPILFIANRYYPSAIGSAAILTTVVFGGLTAVVFITKTDFSFLRMALTIGGLAALGFILCSVLFSGGPGGIVGVIFSVAMVVLASACILYSTSNVLHHYRTTQYVAASLALFAAVALLFWYILQLVMAFSSD